MSHEQVPMRLPQRDQAGDLILCRRSLLIGAAALITAPAIVRASSLMPVKVYVKPNIANLWFGYDINGKIVAVASNYSDLALRLDCHRLRRHRVVVGDVLRELEWDASSSLA
jgi:hypothetical protein